ncbi:MAG: glycosyltransferase [Paracoccus sp. (in: a-proteobacteria)]
MRDAIIGICRFSFLGKCDWVETRDADGGSDRVLSARLPKIYDPARLERRFEAFEKLCLPSIKAQTDPDFQFWFLTSPEMPVRWLERLRDLTAAIPQVRIIVSAERTPMDALQMPLRAAADAAGRPVIQFRTDDDDAFSRHHVARIRKQAARFPDLPGFGISYPEGLVFGSFEGDPVSYHRAHQSFVGAGAALRMRAPGRCIYAFNHAQIPKFFPAFTSIEGLGYVQTRWDASDSAGHTPGRWPYWFKPISHTEFNAALQEDFPFLNGVDLGFVQKKGAA